MFLGSMAYLDAKARGNKSMPSGGGHREDVEGGLPRNPRDMAKAGLPESQSPEGESDAPAGKTSETGVVFCVGMNRWAGATSRRRFDAQRGHLRR